ncbi:hypothetical protein PAE4_50231 [Bacillus altitudinis]|nr:hypothetical protein PAE4_50231 [Bacillus altitudinis]
MNSSITKLLKRTDLTETEKSKLVAELKKHFQQRKARINKTCPINTAHVKRQ